MEKIVREVVAKYRQSSEDFDDEAVYFAINNEDSSKTESVCKISKDEDEGEWIEELIAGVEPYGFGGKRYQSYLDKADIMT